MRILIVSLFVLLASARCTQQTKNDEQIIKDLLFEQQDAWNKGDIESFMKAYWVSDSLKFIGAKGITYGYTNTFEGYKKRYPDKATMGKLEFEILHLSRLSNDSFQLIGSWDLVREKGDIGGHFTLIWRRIDGKWRIVSDHTSAK